MSAAASQPMSPLAAKTHRAQRALTGAILFCLAFMIVEIWAGIKAHSLALITDAMHLLTDVAALSLSLFATYVSQWAGSQRLNFGWHRAEVVGAMGSVFLVWALAGFIMYEAIERLHTMVHCADNPAADRCDSCRGVDGVMMFAVGWCGFFVNVICAVILMVGGHAHSHGGLPGGTHSCSGHGHSHGGHGHSHGGASERAPLVGTPQASHGTVEPADAHHNDHHDAEHHGHTHSHGSSDHGHSHGPSKPLGDERNMNVRGAMIHAIGDCVQSIGVVIAASIIWGATGSTPNEHSWYNIADPITSLFFAIVTLYTTRWLAVDVFFVLMEATPDGISYQELHDAFEAIPNVTAVDHLHVWALTPSLKSLSVHLVCPRQEDHQAALRAAKACARRFGIDHATVQIELVSEDSSSEVSLAPLCVSMPARPATGSPTSPSSPV